jgi:hypothetical protein
MYNQIVYGSLLHPKELKKHGISIDRISFVKVKNFKRIFNQEPSWRKAEGINRAVLNIQKDKTSWFNAIVIKGITNENLIELDKRERGYDRINLKDGLVIEYKNNKIVKNCFVYIGKERKQNKNILPNNEYFGLCLRGAKSYFEIFYKDYLVSTYQNSLDGNLELIKL